MLLQEPCAAGYTTKAPVPITCPVLEKVVFVVKDGKRRNVRCCAKLDNAASEAEPTLVEFKTD